MNIFSSNPPESVNSYMSLTLRGALWYAGPAGDKPESIDLVLDFCDGFSTNDPAVWGWAASHYKADHSGFLCSLHVEGNHLTMEIPLAVTSNKWIEGGPASYRIEITCQDEQYSGSFTGTFNEREVSGEVTGRNIPLPPLETDFRAIQPGEHPRLVLRKESLPALRNKCNTPEGKAIVAQLRKTLEKEIIYQGDYGATGGYHAAGHGYLYLITGDEKETEIAREICKKAMETDPTSKGHTFAYSHTILGIALAYDCCYEAWSTEFRSTVANYLADSISRVINGISNNDNFSPGSNWMARTRGSAGVAALAILKDPDVLPLEKRRGASFYGQRGEGIPHEPSYVLKVCERAVLRYVHLMGEHGWGGEGDGYHVESVEMILPFLHSYRRVIGRNIGRNTPAEWILPHYVMRSLLMDSGPPQMFRYGRHGGSMRSVPAFLFPPGMDAVSPELSPGVKWFWNQFYGLQGDGTFGIRESWEALFALQSLSADPKESPPEKIFGRILHEDQWGYFLFRNRWLDKNDIVAEIYLKAGKPVGWNFPEAGTFRIWGLGNAWAFRNDYKSSSLEETLSDLADESQRNRAVENVVLVPGYKGEGSGELIHSSSENNGSGAVSIKMDSVFKSKGPDHSPIIDSVRAFAVDYSQASGVIAVIALLDRLPGVDYAIWQMTTPGKISVNERGFLITAADGSSLKGTFISPAQVNLIIRDKTIQAVGRGEFLVIMTLSNDKHPEVSFSENSLSAAVRIGRQMMQFDGQKIVMSAGDSETGRRQEVQ